MVAGCLALGGLWIFGFIAYMNHDRLELIDSPEVAAVAESSCAALASNLSALQTGGEGSIQSRADLIVAENGAIETLVARVRALGSKALNADMPVAAWLADWERLVGLRADFARELRADPSRLPPRVPTVDGFSIVKRMQDAGVRCRVPGQILDDLEIVGKTR
jgi:hypothetical protein